MEDTYGHKKLVPGIFPIGVFHRGAHYVFLYRSCYAISDQNTVMLG